MKCFRIVHKIFINNMEKMMKGYPVLVTRLFCFFQNSITVATHNQGFLQRIDFDSLIRKIFCKKCEMDQSNCNVIFLPIILYS